MKKLYTNVKKIVLVLVILGLLISLTIYVVKVLTDENALTIEEKTWIDENISFVHSINIVNDSNIFGSSASGVFYDFIDDFSSEYGLSVNPITYKYGTTNSGLTMGIFDNLSSEDVVFYTDHYVLLSTTYEIINSYEEISEITVGILADDSSKVSKVFNGDLVEFGTYEEVLSAFVTDEEINYIIVPRYLFADQIIEKNYEVIFHLSDIEYYYGIDLDDSQLSSIISKYFYGKWQKSFYNSFNENKFDLFVDSLNLTESQLDKISSLNYTYGFLENSPYEVISSGSFGGVSAVLLKEFSDFANTEFEFIKFTNYDDLVTAVNKNDVDVYFSKYDFTSDYDITTNGYSPEYYVVARRDNSIVVNSISGLSGKDVYVEANSKLYSYLKSFDNINLLTYANEKELFSLNKENVIIILDSNSYEFYSISDLDKYTSRYSFNTDFNSGYAVSTDDVLFTLINKYMNLEDDSKILIDGINNHFNTLSIGTLLASFAKYILALLLTLLVIIIVFVQKSKKIQIARKIKKDDKLKYIDQLTSLKNRNYLNESKESWDNNTIYPQAIVLVDLNKIQKLNDQFGYKEGDKQIQTFANSLIKSQLDNTEIMRTDGNEFVIYLVGYGQKQIVNYIRKLNKEVDKLPHDEGAKFGYSIIENNLTTVEDALNEAANDMIEKHKND